MCDSVVTDRGEYIGVEFRSTKHKTCTAEHNAFCEGMRASGHLSDGGSTKDSRGRNVP